MLESGLACLLAGELARVRCRGRGRRYDPDQHVGSRRQQFALHDGGAQVSPGGGASAALHRAVEPVVLARDGRCRQRRWRRRRRQTPRRRLQDGSGLLDRSRRPIYGCRLLGADHAQLLLQRPACMYRSVPRGAPYCAHAASSIALIRAARSSAVTQPARLAAAIATAMNGGGGARCRRTLRTHAR